MAFEAMLKVERSNACLLLVYGHHPRNMQVALDVFTCSSTAPAVDRVQPIPSLTLRQPSASPSGLPLWWEVAAHEQRDAGEQAEPTSIPAAAAAEKAATLLRVIVNVRINGREPKVCTGPVRVVLRHLMRHLLRQSSSWTYLNS